MSTKRGGEPFPVRLFDPECSDTKSLKQQTGLSVSEIIRRSLRFSLPKFLSGEVDISRVVVADKFTTPDGK